jgi:hypothetical protein
LKHGPKRLSLSPLKFDEAITNVLKIKPEPKPSRKVKATPRKSKAHQQSPKN